MKRAVLEALFLCWERKSQAPDVESGSEDAKLFNARNAGWREGMRACAEDLRTLLAVLGDDDGPLV